MFHKRLICMTSRWLHTIFLVCLEGCINALKDADFFERFSFEIFCIRDAQTHVCWSPNEGFLIAGSGVGDRSPPR